MLLITQETRMSDIINSEPNVITVMNRFGICLGVGDNNIKKTCLEKNIDESFLTCIFNTFINKEYIPNIETIQRFNANEIVNYLIKTNNYYKQFQIPNIERHFGFLIKSCKSDNNLTLLMNFFHEVKNELLGRIENDNNEIFPQILNISDSNKKKCIDEINIPNNDDSLEGKLSDLKNMFIIHLRGEYDVNLCHAVLFAIISLEKDIKQNNRIRKHILIPYLEALNNEH